MPSAPMASHESSLSGSICEGWVPNWPLRMAEDYERPGAEAHDQRATALQEVTTGRSHAFCPRHIFEWRAACERGQSSGTTLPQSVADLLVRGVGFRIEKSFRRQDHAAQAISALRRSLIDERLLNRMRLLRSAESFQRGDLGLANRAHRHHAGPHNLPAQHHGARAALRQATPKPRSTQAKLVVQNKQQRRVRIDFHRVGAAIHLESDLLHNKILRLFAGGCR